MKYQYKDDFSLSPARSAAAPTTSRSASTTSTSRSSAATSPPAPPASTPCRRRPIRARRSPTSPSSAASPATSTPIKQYSGYVQDDICVNDRLTLNVGLRYDSGRASTSTRRSNPIWQTLSTQTKYNESYLQDFQGGKGGKLKNDNEQLGAAPRLHLRPHGRRQALAPRRLRPLLRLPVHQRHHPLPGRRPCSRTTAWSTTSTTRTASATPNGTFFQPGQPLPPNQLPGAPQSIRRTRSPRRRWRPRTREQASLGYSWQVNDWLGLNFEAVAHRLPGHPVPLPRQPDRSGHRRSAASRSSATSASGYGNGKANYDGAQHQLPRPARPTSSSCRASTPTPRPTGNVLAGADEFRLTDAGYQPDLRGARDVSVNPLDPLCGACFGPLNTDARHRVTLSAVYQAPWGINVSGMFRYRSATPYTDLHRQRPERRRLPLRPAAGRLTSTPCAATRSRSSTCGCRRIFNFGPVGIELIAEVFNLFNEKNPAGFTVPSTPPATRPGSSPPPSPATRCQGEQRLAQLGLRIRF